MIRAVGDAISTAIIAAQLTLASSILIVVMAAVPGVASPPVTNLLHVLAGCWTVGLSFVQAALGPIVG